MADAVVKAGAVVAPVVAELVKVAPEVQAEVDAHAEGFVKMMKADLVSFVHATTVEAHKAVGWVVAAWKHV